MAARNKLVIFDCDGTLVDSQHMILAAMRQTFEEAGLTPADDADVRSIVGLNLYEAMRHLLPEAEQQQHLELEERYKRHFYTMRVEHAADPDPLFKGTREALQMLDEQGYLLGIATGNSRRGLDRVIKEHDLKDLFVTLQTADGHPSKPHPSMIHTAVVEVGAEVADTIMVGDTSYDMTMSAQAGSKGMGVSWGYHSADTLREAGADHVVNEFSEVPKLVERWLGKV